MSQLYVALYAYKVFKIYCTHRKLRCADMVHSQYTKRSRLLNAPHIATRRAKSEDRGGWALLRVSCMQMARRCRVEMVAHQRVRLRCRPRCNRGAALGELIPGIDPVGTCGRVKIIIPKCSVYRNGRCGLHATACGTYVQVPCSQYRRRTQHTSTSSSRIQDLGPLVCLPCGKALS